MRNVVTVATGTAAAQAVTIALAPIITRLYSPEAFGTLGTFTAILMVATPLATLTYPIAIVLPKADEEAKILGGLSACLAIGTASIVAAVLLVGGDRIVEYWNLQKYTDLLFFIPVAMVFAAFFEILSQWLIRKHQFKVTAQAALKHSSIVNFTKISVGLFYPTALTLVAITTVGQLVYALLLCNGLRGRSTQHSNLEGGMKSALSVAIRYKDFPMFRAPQVALNAFSESLPVLVLAGIFGPSSAGLFALCRSALAAPALLVGGSVGNVFYPRAVEIYNNCGDIQQILLKSTGALFAIGVIPFSIVMLLGPSIFTIVFGAEWNMAGEYGRWMALWLLCYLAARPAIASIPIMGLQKVFLGLEMSSLLVKGLGLYVGYKLGSSVTSVMLFSLASAGTYIIIFFVVWRCSVSLRSSRG